jgi:hypothetical protein
MDADYNQLVRILLFKSFQVRQNVVAVDTAVCPKVQKDNLALEIFDTDRAGRVDPVHPTFKVDFRAILISSLRHERVPRKIELVQWAVEKTRHGHRYSQQTCYPPDPSATARVGLMLMHDAPNLSIVFFESRWVGLEMGDAPNVRRQVCPLELSLFQGQSRVDSYILVVCRPMFHNSTESKDLKQALL